MKSDKKRKRINYIFKLNPATYANAQAAYEQPDLSPGEISELILKSRSGNNVAKSRIVESYLKHVYNVVGSCYYLKSVAQDIDDFIQEGDLGLYDAIDHFNSEKASFATYSAYWIRKKVSLFMNKRSGIIVLDEKQKRMLKMVERIEYEYEQEHGEKPSQSMLEKLTNKNAASIKRIMQMKMYENVVSLDQVLENQMLSDDQNDTEIGMMFFEESIINKMAAEQIVKELYRRVEKEIDFKILDFFMNADAGATHNDCAEELSVSRQYVTRRVNILRELLKNIFHELKITWWGRKRLD